MRKIVLTLAVLMLTAVPALAAEFKFGMVDMQEVLQKSEPGAAAFKALKGKFDDMKADLDKRKNEIEKMRADMEKQSVAMTAEAKQEKQLDLQRKARDFQDLYQSYTQKMKSEEEKASKPVIETLIKVIQDYGKKNGYTAIFDRKGSGLLYADDATDVTSQVTADLNAAWKSKK